MNQLGVIGNISIDCSNRQGMLRTTGIGGAALYVALAAARAGLRSRPLSLIGTDLIDIQCNPLLSILDLSGVKTIVGKSAVFTLTYDADGVLRDAAADYGVTVRLTTHAIEQINSGQDSHYHVCCRRPLDITRVLDVLVDTSMPFSVDFFLPSAAESVTAAATALPMAQVVFVNAAEYDLLTRAISTRCLRDVLVTDGPRPARLIRSGHCIAQVIPPSVATLDVTGSGDTLAGTFLAARTAGLDGEIALKQAVYAASHHATLPAIQFTR